ncbi:diphthamide biosynthesis protein [Phellopilus nigrolimitatus]|nr:diphthamide biosynthesis protein [Phellopilus nigrolimitatus]
MATQPFSASGEDVIYKPVDVLLEETPIPGSRRFETYYELERTARLIEEGDYKRFPDELLHDSVPVYRALQSKLGPTREAYVLADTSYGSCCVDEVAASHVEADFLVHYGHACLSRTSRLPVFYVFGQKDLDIGLCVDKISAYVSAQADGLQTVKVLELKHDVAYGYLADDLLGHLRSALGDRFHVAYDPLPNQTFPESATNQRLGVCRTDGSTEDLISGRKHIIWIGEESSTLTKLLMTSSGNDVISYSPVTRVVQPQTHLTNRLLMRRYALLQKARDADVYGILIGTLGVASYLPLITHLRSQLKRAHKKSYTVSVGKINPSKLANFMEIECWIWVACSEGMVDSKDYLRPIITPYELELALQPEPSWTGKYVFDFQELLAKASLEEENNEKENIDSKDGDLDTDRPMFSLVTGTYRHAKRYGDVKHESTAATQDLIHRTQESALARTSDRAAAQFLHSRTYQGLDPHFGQDEPGVLEQGRSGIARGYSDDHGDG